MTTQRSFRRRPPFLIPERARATNLPCDPKISQRGTHPTYYPEFAMFPGPQTLAVTGDNSFNTLFGREWAILFCDDFEFYVLQWTDGGEGAPPGLESGGWTVITDPLLTLPAFDGTERAFTAAFDQSARLIIAYEKAGVIRVTRWDTDVGAYVQNVNFAGVDPTLLMDASITRRVPDSDVILFYVTSDREGIHYRVQRETYGTPRDLTWGETVDPVAYPDGLVLDYAQALRYRFELLVAHPTGAKRSLALVSDLYPIPISDPLAMIAAPAPGEHRQTTAKYEFHHELDATVTPSVGVYALTITRHDAVEHLDVTAVPGLSLYVATTEPHAASEPLALTTAPADGVYNRTTFRHQGEDGPLLLSAAPGTGAYRATS